MKTSARASDWYGFEVVNRKDRSGLNGPSFAPAVLVAALWVAVILWTYLDPSIVLGR